jgi:predicted nucleic acid-binding protein
VIVLDTDVVSALMRREIDPVVVAWLDAQPSESIWTTALAVWEVRSDLELLAEGRSRRHLEAAFEGMLRDDLEGRVLPFEQIAAWQAALIADRRKRAGQAIVVRDAQIAGIVAARRGTLATRNTRHFSDLGIALVDPWAVR